MTNNLGELRSLEEFDGSELYDRLENGTLLGYFRLGGTAVWLARISVLGREYKVPLEDIYRAGDLNHFLPPNELPVPDVAELQRERDRIVTSLGISASLDRQARYDRYLAYFKETALPLATLPLGLAPAWIVWRAATDQLSNDIQYTVDAAQDISEKLSKAANKAVGEGIWKTIKPWLPWIAIGGAAILGVRVAIAMYLRKMDYGDIGDMPEVEANLEKYLADKLDSFDKNNDFSRQLSNRPVCRVNHEKARKALVEARGYAAKDRHIAAAYSDAAHELDKRAMWSCFEGTDPLLLMIQAHTLKQLAKKASRGELDFHKPLAD